MEDNRMTDMVLEDLEVVLKRHSDETAWNLGVDGNQGLPVTLGAGNPQFSNGQVSTYPQAPGNAQILAGPIDSTAPGWLQIAYAEMRKGVHEYADSPNNPTILKYQRTTGVADDEVPWCSSFVNWCVEQVGYRGTRSARAKSWMNWGVNSPVQIGAIVVFDRGGAKGHVGFYVGEANGRILVLGGNQSNSVKITSYAKASILGYRWPGIGNRQ